MTTNATTVTGSSGTAYRPPRSREAPLRRLQRARVRRRPPLHRVYAMLRRGGKEDAGTFVRVRTPEGAVGRGAEGVDVILSPRGATCPRLPARRNWRRSGRRRVSCPGVVRRPAAW